MRQVEAEFLYIFQGLAAAIGPVYEAKVVKMNVTVHMGIGNIRRKDGEKGKLLLYPFREGKVGCFRTMGHIGVFFVGMEDEVVDIDRRAYRAWYASSGTFQALFRSAWHSLFPL